MRFVRKKSIIMFLILGLIILSSCGKADKTGKEKKTTENEGVKIEFKEGIKNIYNSSRPLKGSVTLELEKTLELDSLKNPNIPAFFNRFAHDQEDNIYLLNTGAVKAYKINKEGKLVAEFLRKGDGPGEFPQYLDSFQIIGSDIWVSQDKKIARYNNSCAFIGETSFNKSYTQIGFVDENRFIADYYEYSKEEKEIFKPVKRICALIQKDQTVLVKYLEAENAGFTELRTSNQIIRLFNGSFTNDILHAIDRDRGIVYLFLSGEYKIILKNLLGETQMVIHREYRNKIIDDAIKKAILEDSNNILSVKNQKCTIFREFKIQKCTIPLIINID